MRLPATPTSSIAEQVSRVVKSIIDEVLSPEVMEALVSLRSHSTYTFAHSINTAIGAILLGRSLRLDRASLREIALGSLLHDLGKIKIDPSILHKPGPLSEEEWEIVRQHPQWGYELIGELALEEIIPGHIALQHHERQDGKGYPRGLRGTNRVARSNFERFSGKYILLAAEIVAISDVYTALVSERPHRPAFPAEQAVATLRAMAGTYLNQELVDIFLSLTPTYPVGIPVRIRAGRFAGYYGIVSHVPQDDPHRPTVHLLADSRGLPVWQIEIDLRQELAEIESTLLLPPSSGGIAPPHETI